MTLNRRIFLYFFSTFFFMLLIITFFQYQREKEYRTEQLDQQLSTYNVTINKYIQEKKPNWESLKNYISLFPDTNLRVTVVDSVGNVLFDSFVKKDVKLENHLQRPEIRMASQSGNGKAIRNSASTGKDYYYLAQKFKHRYVRSSLPYNVNLVSMLKANTLFLNFMVFLLIVAVIALYFISRNLTRSIDRLRIFTQKAEKGEAIDTEMKFPNGELGEISNNIVQMYKQLLATKDQMYSDREKLITHLQISQEGLAIFSSEKKEILANSQFIQYTNIISDTHVEHSDEIFKQAEFIDLNKFIVKYTGKKDLNKQKFTINKGGRVFSLQCVVFQDDTFEISISEITIQEHENELKRHLTQNISHELRTPVSSILGYMESILENPNIEPERQHFFVERSFQQAQRLRDLLQDISMLNKIDEGKRLFELEDCNINEVIDNVLDDLNLEIEQKEFLIAKNVASDIKIKGNRSLIYSIFRNLVDNALAYAGNKLTLQIDCYREDEQFYYFSFSDNGVGVSEEHLIRLFERFYRVDKGRSRKMGGTGLGLAIVKNAVIFHGGNISAKNIPEGGLSFIFSMKKQ